MEQGQYRLLIADDEENILRAMEKYIRAHTRCFGTIYCAGSGEQALDLIFRHRPDVMLIDVQMPEKTGLEVMREAAQAGVCPKTVILSGFDTFSYAQQALRMGAADYLLKPCRSSEILEKLEGLVAPAEKPQTAPAVEGNHLLTAAAEYCREHMAEELSLSDVAEYVHVTPNYLSMLFSQNLGGFVDFLNRTRIECACDYMHDSTLKIYEIAYRVGFRDEKYFSKVFKKITGKSPSTYRRGLGLPEE